MEGIYRFADLTVKIEYQHEYFKYMAADYEVASRAVCKADNESNPDIAQESGIDETISITEFDIRSEAKRNEETDRAHDGVIETLAIYRKLCERLIHRNVLLIHASAIAKDGKAYLFVAPSGTGKSTHTRLWRETFGDKVFMINDDKPLLRFDGESFLAYGTPWNGKHHLDTNVSVPIGGICFLGRGVENKIWKVSAGDGLVQLLASVYRPDAADGMKKTLELVAELTKRVPLWQMECNISPEAAIMACEAMTQEERLGRKWHETEGRRDHKRN
ncbi:MAG: hypothetical protein K6F31_06445 [Acetatifactor sp.]|nr:hypothetical protein [Acetatifactor sp.]